MRYILKDYAGWKGWMGGIMKNIQLLTMDSYLETKKELVENANYKLEELQIDNVDRLKEITKEIEREYFEEGREYEDKNIFPIKVWKMGGYFEINSTLGIGRDVFLEGLKNRYSQLMQEQRYMEIVEDIESTITNKFINICELPSSYMERVYEIIKYTLSQERRCDYLDNGQFITEMSEKDIFPFKVINDTLPIYCQDMQRVLFGVHRKIFVNSTSLDITRFSFYNVKKIVDAVTKTLTTEEKSLIYKKDNEDYNKGYIEGVEDYILLDKILGISLTNIIYWKTKGIDKREVQDNIIEIVFYLAKCYCSIGRNSVTEVLLDYLEATDYNENILREIREVLKRKIKMWNEYYEEAEAVILCPIFSYLKECSEKDLIEMCESKENDSIWDKGAWGEYIYMEEIAKISEMIKVKIVKSNEKEDKIRIPKGNMDNRTWYAYIHKTVFDAIWD